MKKIAYLMGQYLEWKQPSALRMHYELHAGEEIAATLRFRSLFGSFATGESADGCWTFKRAGFFKTYVTIRQCDQEKDLAIFKNNTWKGGGTLELQDGRKLSAGTNFWQTRMEVKTESEQVFLTYKTGGFIHQSAEVIIEPGGIQIPELPWIVMLGFYLIVLMQSDAAATVAVVGAT